jgi:hypothetical protein
MATNNAVELTRELIAYTVLTDKNSLVELLSKNGIKLTSSASDKEVTVATLLASSKSTNFKNDLIILLGNKLPQAANDFSQFVGGSEMFGFTGIDDFSFTGAEDFWKNATANENLTLNYIPKGLAKPSTTSSFGYKPMGLKTPTTTYNPSTSTDTTTKPKGTFLAGVGRFLTDNIFTKENINAGVQIGLTKINNKVQSQTNAVQQEAQILQDTQNQMNQNLPQKKSNNTLVYVVGGVAVLGIVGFLVFKKK